MRLQAHVNQQLVRIKLLYRQALQHSDRADEVSLILLVLMLDFVVETFLKVVIYNFPRPQGYAPPQSGYSYKLAQLENTPYSPKLDFARAGDEVVGILRDPQNSIPIRDLPMRREMDRLHEIRNDVQHKCAIPHPSDGQKYITLVDSFLRACFEPIFGVDYDAMSPMALVRDPQVKAQLEKAHAALGARDWQTAAKEAAIGFDMLLALARAIASEDPFFGKLHAGADIFGDLSSSRRRQIERMVEQINELRERFLFTDCGLDYLQYLRLRHIFPAVGRSEGGQYWVEFPKDYSEDEAKRILSFVEGQVLQFQVSGIYRQLAEGSTEGAGP